jgi:hypothetical protein
MTMISIFLLVSVVPTIVDAAFNPMLVDLPTSFQPRPSSFALLAKKTYVDVTKAQQHPYHSRSSRIQLQSKLTPATRNPSHSVSPLRVNSRSANAITTTALPLYVDTSQSASMNSHGSSSKQYPPSKLLVTPSSSSSSLSYRNDQTMEESMVDVHVVDTVNPMYFATSQFNWNEDVVAHVSGRPDRPSLTRIAKLNGSMDHPSYQDSPTNQNSVVEIVAATSHVASVVTELPPQRKSTSTQLFQQRISYFDGEPFFSLSNLEYGVSPDEIRNAAGTGLCFAVVAIMSLAAIPHVDQYSYHAGTGGLDWNMVFASSSMLWTIPACTAYLSITRSTVGGLTRTVSNSVMNVLRLIHVVGTQVAVVVGDNNSNAVKSGGVEPYTEDCVDTNVRDVMVTAGSMRNSLQPELTPPHEKSLPTLVGELFWYSSLALYQRTEHTIRHATDTMFDRQVEATRIHRLQRQERKQRALLEAQFYYRNQPKMSTNVWSKNPSPVVDNTVVDSEATVPTIEMNLEALLEEQRIRMVSVQQKEATHRTLLQMRYEFERTAARRRRWEFPSHSEPPNLLISDVEEPSDPILLRHEHVFLLSVEDTEENVVGHDEVSVNNSALITEAFTQDDLFQQEHVFLLSVEDPEENVVGHDEVSVNNPALITEAFLRDELVIPVGTAEDTPLNFVAERDPMLLSGQDPRLKHEHVFLLGGDDRVVESSPEKGILTEQVVLQNDKEPQEIDFAEDVSLDLIPEQQKRVLTEQKVVLDEKAKSFAENLVNFTDTVVCDEEKRAIADTRRFIREIAMNETKKRLMNVNRLSSDSDSKKQWNEIQDRLVVVSNVESNAVNSNSKRSKTVYGWEKLSRRAHQIQQFLVPAAPSGISSIGRYSVVQRAALFLVALSSPLFLVYWMKQEEVQHSHYKNGIE